MPPLLDAARLLLAAIDQGEPVFGIARRRSGEVAELRAAIRAAERLHGCRCNACGRVVNLTNPNRPRLRPDPHWFDSLTRGPRLISADEMGGDERVARELRW